MISIVAAYYNRKKLFYQTLRTIKKSEYKDIEFIAVDDGSDPEQRLESFKSEFKFLKIIRLERENKWYVNPCIPFNIGISASKGDIIVLQNPECIHVHDVLKYVSENVNDSNYISISAYGLTSVLTKDIFRHRENKTLPQLLNSFPQVPYTGYDTLGWYNHSVYRPTYFHFCSAITRNNMEKLNGFDERFATGIGYDDDEITARIRMLGLKTIITEDVSVIHQYHDSVYYGLIDVPKLCEQNHQLLLNTTMKENNFHANTKKLWSGI